MQMLLLEEAMHDAQMGFNHRFLALREVKRKVRRVSGIACSQDLMCHATALELSRRLYSIQCIPCHTSELQKHLDECGHTQCV
jgi:hypothetical protein